MAKKQEQKLVVNQIVIKPPTRKTFDVGEWRTALQSADMGRVKTLYDLFDDLLIDGTLSDAIDKRIQAITNSALTFQDASGKEVDDMVSIIDTTAFEDLLKCIMEQLVWGRSGGEFDFTKTLPDGRPSFGFTAFPAKHIKPENKSILINDYDESGVPYENDDHLLILARARQFGMLLKAAPYTIYKRGGFGDYAQWLELFGMPQRVGKYSSFDPESRRLLEAAMEAAGSAPYIVIPKETEVETLTQSSSGDGGSYNEFRRACNEEILITVLGQTLTTMQNETGARSLGEVHQDVENTKHRSDIRYVQRVLNETVLPLLERRGFPVAGGKFVFPESAEELTVNDVVMLSDILEIPASFLHDKYSIPVPENGEPIARRQAQPVMISPGEPPDKGKDDQEIKNADLQPVPKSSGWLHFFADAPLAIRGAIRNLFLSDKQPKVTQIVDVDKLVNKAIKELYRKKGNTGNTAAVDNTLFEVTNRVLQKGISGSFGTAGAEWNRQNHEFTRQFSENAAVFSAFKNHKQTAEIVSKLYRDDGSIRSFSEFKKEALKISQGYNKNWLQTEYNTAVRSARMAVNWKKFEETKHLYPNLEYMPSRAAHPRDSHRLLWHCIFAIDDPVWNSIMPPSDWNCLCSVRATNKPVTPFPEGFSMDGIDPVFDNNPGKTAKFLNTGETEYFKSASSSQRPIIMMYANGKAKQTAEIIEKYIGKKGEGYLNIVKQQGHEREKNLLTYKLLADAGGKYSLREPGGIGKNPDAINEITGKLSDAKHPETANGKNAIKNSIRSGSKQKVDEIIIRLTNDYSKHSLFEGFKSALQKDRAKTVKDIILILRNGRILRFKANELRKHFIKRTKGS